MNQTRIKLEYYKFFAASYPAPNHFTKAQQLAFAEIYVAYVTRFYVNKVIKATLVTT
ncbi:hypothetical protein ACFLXQ_05340 [Chloroflexota bacterium]